VIMHVCACRNDRSACINVPLCLAMCVSEECADCVCVCIKMIGEMIGEHM